MTGSLHDALVIGGGPAGLSATLYLARYDRTVALFDTGHGRSSWRQVNHNYLGFPGGVPTRRLLELGREQVAEYEQVAFLHHKIERFERRRDMFVACGQAGAWHGRVVILCMGVVDRYPHFEGWEEYVGRSMFWCLACDGYGGKGARIVVAGNTNSSALEALQLARFTDRVTLLTDSHECHIDERRRRLLGAAGIPVIHDKIKGAEGTNGQFQALHTDDGRRIALDQLFCQHGATPQTDLAQDLGVTLSREGYIEVDNEQKTNVPGVFAAGDATRLHAQQVTTAVHEGAQAASAANYYLYPPDLRGE